MIRLLVSKGAAVFTFSLLIIIAGVLSYIRLPRESSPEIKQPYVFVTTVYPGVGAKEVENLVSRVIEEEIDGVEGLLEVSSSSQQSLSHIFTKFASDVSVEAALRKIQERVDRAKPRLPADAESPSVNELSTSSFPVFIFALSHPDDLEIIDRTARDLRDELRRVKGVLDVEIAGNLEKEVSIELDPVKLEHYGLTLDEVSRAVQLANISIPGGILKNDSRNYSIAVNSEIRDPAQFKDVIVHSGPVKVPLRELGKVSFTYARQQTYSRFNGAPAITLSLTKRSGENIIDVVDDARRMIERLQTEFPAGTQVHYSYDESDYIRQIIADLENNMLTGFVLVMLVTIFFLGFVNSFFVSLAIPFSMLLSFTILEFMGVTLNMVVLFSLILALGMLVDNGIVIVENIFRHGAMGKDKRQAAVDGAKEVAAPIISSTLTTCLAFFPIMFMPDVMGDFMAYVPLTVIVVLGASLLVALTINPVFCSRFMSINEENRRKMTSGGGFFGALQHRYENTLRKAIHNSWAVLVAGFSVVIIGVVLYNFFGKEWIFFVSSDPSDAVVTIQLPQGTPLDKTDGYVQSVEEIVSTVPASLDNAQATAGKDGGGGIFSGSGEEFNKGSVRLSFKSYNEREIKGRTAVDSLRTRLKSFVGAQVKVVEQEMGPPSGHDVSFDLVGRDYAVLGAYTDSILSILDKYSEFKLVETDYEAAKPEVAVTVDRAKAAYHGLSVQAIAATIRNAINGSVIGKFHLEEDEYDIVLRYNDENRNALADLNRLYIVDNSGMRVPLAQLASITPGAAVGVIKRRNQQRSVGIWADFKPNIQNKKEIQAEIDSLVHQINYPQGYRLDEGAGFEMRKNTTDFLGQAFMIALFLIAIVLVVQFNSIGQPVIILVSVFLSLGGVFWGYLLSGNPFVIIMSGIGCISLAGIAVNNSIVLIDYTNLLIKEGIQASEAIVTAAKTRLRPVLLTAITTVLGLLPMAFGISIDVHPGTFGIQSGSEMSEFWEAFAWAIVYGLSFTTLMTLVMIPCMLSIYFKWFPPKHSHTAGDDFLQISHPAPDIVETQNVSDSANIAS
ncbi:MAG: efflux RND transporter permease subunit [Chitinispirillaceae bacterium]